MPSMPTIHEVSDFLKKYAPTNDSMDDIEWNLLVNAVLKCEYSGLEEDIKQRFEVVNRLVRNGAELSDEDT